MPKRRYIHPAEVRLFLFADYADPEGTPLPNSFLHCIRITSNGNKVAACKPAADRLAQGINYWSFPLLDFLIVNAPICMQCMKVMVNEGLIVDTSTPA